jgi:succinate dehydrogenase/fumarate reductase flavoprotein subunit
MGEVHTAAIDVADIREWRHAADVLVVGYGMAGACAAVEASNAGAEVIVVERASGWGGTSALAGGHFYLGGGTAVQLACGFEDSAEAMYQYLMAATPHPEPEKIRAYADDSVEHFDWLERHGVPFERSYYPTKNVLQESSQCLIWTGNEKVWPFRDRARPAPRGHKVAFHGYEGGGGLAVGMLAKVAGAAGVKSLFDTRIVALIVDAQGAVVGARARDVEGEFDIAARRGVVLAAGGFGMNREMVQQYTPQLAIEPFHVQGSPSDDGLGILLGQSAGAAVRHMEKFFATAPFYPPENLLKGILVNRNGKRFVAEDSYHARSTIHCLQQPGQEAYLILDAEIFDYPQYAQMMNIQLVDGWETVAEMEQGLALPQGSLVETMDRYNFHAQRGEDPEFRKYPDWIKPLDKGPYAAFDLTFGTGRAVYTGFTLGGLATTLDAEVLNAEGRRIPGLYAAGACASNIAQDSDGYSSGVCLGEASYFGRRAGRAVAALR